MQVDGGGAGQTATVEINTEEELEAYLVETLGADTLEKAQAGDQEALTRVAGVLEQLGIQMAPQVEQRVVSEEEQIGRNDPCWCGSGKKFKKCHGV